ncbi:AI-2E family transporter [Flagellimonas sp. S174]|uniref:AI-2E family transporter n=1 Tax=Flagellimonas sp. S174 TaxID=3410790 RepID=UPI003BF589FA
MKHLHPNLIRQLFVLMVIIGFAIIIFRGIAPYLTGFLGAITLYVLSYPLMERLDRFNVPSAVGALLLIISSFFLILLPLWGIISMLSERVTDAMINSSQVTKQVKEYFMELEQRSGIFLMDRLQESTLTDWLTSNFTGLLSTTMDTVISIGIMYFILYYMLTNRKKLRKALFHYLPMADSSLAIIEKESKAMVRANALGIPLVAVVQAIIALLGFIIFGIQEPIFWAIIVFIGSMIPIVGTLIGTIPVFIVAIANGQEFQAWGILLYGLIVVGSADNLVRMFAIKKLDNIHPLITLIGVLIGLPLFGFIGLIFGPLLVSIFLVLVKIYKNEFGLSTVDNKAKL